MHILPEKVRSGAHVPTSTLCSGAPFFGQTALFYKSPPKLFFKKLGQYFVNGSYGGCEAVFGIGLYEDGVELEGAA
jgi:hypothetical protein